MIKAAIYDYDSNLLGTCSLAYPLKEDDELTYEGLKVKVLSTRRSLDITATSIEDILNVYTSYKGELEEIK